MSNRSFKLRTTLDNYKDIVQYSDWVLDSNFLELIQKKVGFEERILNIHKSSIIGLTQPRNASKTENED